MSDDGEKLNRTAMNNKKKRNEDVLDEEEEMLAKSHGIIGRPTKVDYEKILAGYDEPLAAAKSEFDRIHRASEVARATYEETGALNRAVLDAIGHQIGRLEVSIDQYEAKKVRLTSGLAAERVASEAADELRRDQYDRVLHGQRLDSELVESKYKAITLNTEHRTDLLDEIIAVTELKHHIEVILRRYNASSIHNYHDSKFDIYERRLFVDSYS